jgi:hypothetical protein
MIPGAILDALVAVALYVFLVRLRLIPAPRVESSAGGAG